MMRVVLDTNVLVSALLTPTGKAAAILMGAATGKFHPCYDYKIFKEYQEVLRRSKFRFMENNISFVLDVIKQRGIYVIPPPLPDAPFTDEDDRTFFETAKYCHAKLITGNIRHFPQDSCIITVSDFYENYLKI